MHALDGRALQGARASFGAVVVAGDRIGRASPLHLAPRRAHLLALGRTGGGAATAQIGSHVLALVLASPLLSGEGPFVRGAPADRVGPVAVQWWGRHASGHKTQVARVYPFGRELTREAPLVEPLERGPSSAALDLEAAAPAPVFVRRHGALAPVHPAPLPPTPGTSCLGHFTRFTRRPGGPCPEDQPQLGSTFHDLSYRGAAVGPSGG